MEVYEKKEGVVIAHSDLDIQKTFDCGQCFRFDWEGEHLKGVAFGRILDMQVTEDGVLLNGIDKDEYRNLWAHYLDMERDYDDVCAALSEHKSMKNAVASGRGIHILNQNPWETLCSFIISQNNNIPRIKKIIADLCGRFGNEIGNTGSYAFPTAEALAKAGAEEIYKTRCGFRAKYLADAAEKVQSGALELEKLKNTSYADAVAALCTVKGVGPKVANCVALFSLEHSEAFPVDVWIKRVLEKYFAPDFDPAVFGNNAGIAQQYLFYNERYHASTM